MITQKIYFKYIKDPFASYSSFNFKHIATQINMGIKLMLLPIWSIMTCRWSAYMDVIYHINHVKPNIWKTIYIWKNIYNFFKIEQFIECLGKI